VRAPGSRPPSFERLRRLPGVGRALDWGMGAGALSPPTRSAGARTAGLKVTESICPYCAVGCGQVVYTRDGELVDIEGNPIKKLFTAMGAAQIEKPGAHMTLLHHGARSGHHAGARRHHRLPAGPPARRLHRHRGSSMAEAHPVGFRWVMKAKERGATVIHVDPRFSRTSALADLHVPIRAGTDIASIGGLIRHVLENDAWFRDYVIAYTQRLDHRQRGLRGHRGASRALIGLRRRQRSLRPVVVGLRHQRAARPHAPASALCLPGAAPPLRALHARDGPGGLRDHPRAIRRSRRGGERNSGRERTPLSSTPWAGPITQPACR